MDTRTGVDTWLRELGKRIGHALALDEEGRCGLAFGNDLVCVVSVPGSTEEVIFSAPLGRADIANREATFERVLIMNLHGNETGGAILGLDPSTDEIVLSARWPWQMVQPDMLGVLLGNFLAVATRLSEVVPGAMSDVPGAMSDVPGAMSDSAAQGEPPQDVFNYIQWRA